MAAPGMIAVSVRDPGGRARFRIVQPKLDLGKIDPAFPKLNLHGIAHWSRNSAHNRSIKSRTADSGASVPLTMMLNATVRWLFVCRYPLRAFTCDSEPVFACTR